MKRNNSLAFFPAILLSLVFYASGIPLVAGQATVLSLVAAGVLIVATSGILQIINTRFGKSSNYLLPPVYVALASANPKALLLNPLHPASLAIAIALLFGIKFFKEDQHNQDAFASNLFLGLSACFFPPAIWLFPLSLIFGFSKATDSARLSFAAVCGVLLPPAVWAGVAYIAGGVPQAIDFLTGIWNEAIAVEPKSIFYSPATIIRIAVITAFTVTAVLKLRKNILVVGLAAFLVIAALFFKNSGEPLCIWTSIAVVIPLCKYLDSQPTSNRRGAFIIIGCLILIAERISFYI